MKREAVSMQKILAIIPYPGLKGKLEKGFNKLTNSYPKLNVKLQIEIANLSNKKQLQKILNKTKADIIISRGGTVDYIRDFTHVTVIDIGISQYDIIRTIKTIPNIKKTGIICYPAFNHAISNTMAQFNIKMEKMVVTKKIDIKNAISHFLSKGCKNILCDSGIIANSSDYQLNFYLIESGDEIVYQALVNCFLILSEKQENNNYYELLINYLKVFHSYTIFFKDQKYSEIIFATDKNKSKVIAKKIRKAIKEQKNIILFEKKKWHLITKKTDKYFIVSLDALGKEKNQDTHHYDENYIPAIYSICYSKHFFKLINYYAKSELPLNIISSPGMEPSYLIDLIAKNRKQKSITINLKDDKKLNYLITKQDSPFFNNNSLLIITGLQLLDTKSLNKFFNFLFESNLTTRNKIIFLIEQSYGTKLNINFPKSLQLNQIILDPLCTISYDTFNLLVHSFFNHFSLITGKTFTGISDTALDKLTSYSWPNNYKEFIQVLLTSLQTSSGPILKGKEVEDTLQHFSLIEKTKPTLHTEIITNKDTKDKTLHDIIVENIRRKLIENNGNKTKTAQQLDISRATLWRYLK